MLRLFTITLIILLALVIGWHIAFFLLGGIIAITAVTWGVIVGSIVAFCAAVMAIFVFAGIGVFVLGSVAAVWSVIAIVLFPVLFPVLAPLFVLLLFLCYFRRRQLKKTQDKIV